MNADDVQRLGHMLGSTELGERTEQVVKLQAELTTMLDHYSRALDEIYRLRTALAYEAQVNRAHLGYKTFPKSRRYVAEHQIERMVASAQGQAERAYAETSSSSLSHVRREAGIETLTRHQWETNTGSKPE